MEPEPVNVLIVDDRESNRLALAEVLEPIEENVVCLESGEAALRYLLNGEAAVVLLDVDMPGLDGFETARLIRGRAKTRNLPIVFVTALDAGDEHAIRGYDLGAVDYMVKPVIPEIVRAKVAVFVELYLSHRDQVRSIAGELESEREMMAAWLERERGAKGGSTYWSVTVERRLDQHFRSTLKAWTGTGETSEERHHGARDLAGMIALAGGGARELLALHRRVADEIMLKAPIRHGRALREKCRLLTLEVMGHLAEYFRQKASQRNIQKPEDRRGRTPDRRSP